jgi:hypothetical protein
MPLFTVISIKGLNDRYKGGINAYKDRINENIKTYILATSPIYCFPSDIPSKVIATKVSGLIHRGKGWKNPPPMENSQVDYSSLYGIGLQPWVQLWALLSGQSGTYHLYHKL